MPAATDSELVSFGEWTLRVRAAQTSNPRLLMLLHGWTGDENSAWIFVRAFPPDYWMIAPRGRLPAALGGFTWRMSREPISGLPTFSDLRASAADLLQLADEYAAAVKIPSAQLDLLGFSQGAALVNVIGMSYPRRVGRMAVLAGFVPAGMEELVAQKPLSGKKIFVAHGAQDQMVPVGRARASVAELEQAGARVVYCEDDVAHKLSAKCLRALEAYFKD